MDRQAVDECQLSQCIDTKRGGARIRSQIIESDSHGGPTLARKYRGEDCVVAMDDGLVDEGRLHDRELQAEGPQVKRSLTRRLRANVVQIVDHAERKARLPGIDLVDSG